MKILIAITLILAPLSSHAHEGQGNGQFNLDFTQSNEWNTGGRLVREVLQCGKCHSPRENPGATQYDLNGPLSGFHGPNITQDPETGIGDWSIEDIEYFLYTGMTPDGDVIGGEMSDVIRRMATMTQAQRRAIAIYLKDQGPAISTTIQHGGTFNDPPASRR